MDYKYTRFCKPDEGELLTSYFDYLIEHMQNEVEIFLKEAKIIIENYEESTEVKGFKDER